MEKAILGKAGEILGIVEVPESQHRIDVCDGYVIDSCLWKAKQPLNLRTRKLSCAKKVINSQGFLSADVLTVDKEGIVNLCTE